MKIAFLSFYNGSLNRGVETLVDELAPRLSINNTVDVFQQGKPKSEVNYRIFRVPLEINWKKKDMVGMIWRRFFVDYWSRRIGLFTLKTLPRIFKERYDVVYPLNGGWMTALLRLATWIYGGKLVLSGQSGMGWDDRINLWAFPDCFIALSRRGQLWAKHANPLLRNVPFIPNGVDLSEFRREGKKFKTNLKKPIILCVGALTEQKRIDLVIKAITKLGDTSLLVVGDGELKGTLEKLGRELLGNRYRQISMKHDHMPPVYRAADVFTLVPSGSEAFGIVYVEAMAANLPVVTINDEQRRGIVGRAGIFVDPTNTNAYAIALANALRLKWGKRPHSQAKKFDWDLIAQKYEKLLNTLVK
jgi:glycosyltransferase involved in cell wall biosynthesis